MRIWYAFSLAVVVCFLMLAADLQSVDDARAVASASGSTPAR
jgi:hypothetical protein